MLAALLLSMVSGCGWAQQPANGSAVNPAYQPSMTFDVASIRESAPTDSYSVSAVNPAHSSEATLNNFDLTNLLGMAYDAQFIDTSGLPAWTNGAMFNVQAKSDRSVDERLAKLSDAQAAMEKQHMFRVLLADRMKLKVHWETRPSKVWELTVAKGGSKLHPSGSVPPTAQEKKNFGGDEIPPLYQRGDGQRGYEFLGHGCSMALLVEELTSQMGVPVKDHTGLMGTYDFILQYHGRVPEDANDNPEVWPALTVAVPDQLGLKMVKGTGEAQFLVIDHVEKPSAN
jgi:uncharacterized protein (TIGR03435 family)